MKTKKYSVILDYFGYSVNCMNNGKTMLDEEQYEDNVCIFCNALEDRGYIFDHYSSYGDKSSVTTNVKPAFLLRDDYNSNWTYSEY